MKNLKMLAFLFIATLTLFTSCKKDSENDVAPTTNIVGEWTVSEGSMDIYQSGTLLADVVITTSGTITFDADGTGYSDFTLRFGDEEADGKGPFTWEEDGFELLVTKANSETERWVRVDDEKNLQTIQYTVIDDDDPTVESELTLSLRK